MDYNFQYLLDLYHDDNANKSIEHSYELNKIINRVDHVVDESDDTALFHIVPVLYSMAFFVGTLIMIYKILI